MKKTETIAARIKDLKDRKATIAKDIECCELSWLGRVCLQEQIMKIDHQIEGLSEQIKGRADRHCEALAYNRKALANARA